MNAPARHTTPFVLALVGPRRSGKDTIAAMLGLPTFPIAAPLKDGVATMFGIPRADLDSDAKDRPLRGTHGTGTTPRELMQRIGTDVAMPALGRRVWVDQCVRAIRASGLPAAAVPDVRFPHEYEALREAFGDRLTVVRVERPGVARDAPADAHASETAWTDVPADRVIVNSGTLRDLAWRAMTVGARFPRS